MIKVLIALHVLGGSIAVLGMLCALSTQKGGRWHKIGGRGYVFGMAVSLILATVVSLLTANIFLLLIAVFTAYLVYTGWRLVKVKDGRKSTLDHRLSLLMILGSIAMFGYGVFMLTQGQSLGIALLVFGFLAGAPALTDYKSPGVWPKGKERIVLHLNRMGGGCIATITAVFVVNVQTNPEFIAWLLPSIVGAPLIIYWSRRTMTGKTAKTA